MVDLRILKRLLPKDVHDLLNFQLKACGSRIKECKAILWTKEATIYRNSQVPRDVGMSVRGEMFTDASGGMSIGFTNITGTAACT